ncbi:uncharacterized protein AMSG_11727 [Thecamonas trahens ATCC 50062]|uniref:Uncharacterized protein n=1 Tax=Thecamonas trahens ATCC 50062 TaxID=461836 RepID=A0A0L0D6D8_THETB|nr:hypothetical protein AMSG_11727 [Thecamonas trahens ATCC 50062]KNC47626.1 hypothetical protein AMSG_11727 [Thecamonas trahens ATCC 50062]|eukprot:XP_013759571.1 hypothetical protein AMSG_11727 [Thecamonas trahens ATCC 50062]
MRRGSGRRSMPGVSVVSGAGKTEAEVRTGSSTVESGDEEAYVPAGISLAQLASAGVTEGSLSFEELGMDLEAEAGQPGRTESRPDLGLRSQTSVLSLTKLHMMMSESNDEPGSIR